MYFYVCTYYVFICISKYNCPVYVMLLVYMFVFRADHVLLENQMVRSFLGKTFYHIFGCLYFFVETNSSRTGLKTSSRSGSSCLVLKA